MYVLFCSYIFLLICLCLSAVCLSLFLLLFFSLSHSLTHSLSLPPSPSLPLSPSLCLTHSLTLPLTLSFTHSPSHSLLHSLSLPLSLHHRLAFLFAVAFSQHKTIRNKRVVPHKTFPRLHLNHFPSPPSNERNTCHSINYVYMYNFSLSAFLCFLAA